MEFGEDLLRRRGIVGGTNGASSDNGELLTDATSVDPSTLCGDFGAYSQFECHRRLWMFVAGEARIETPADLAALTGRTCARAPTPALQDMCEVGFGGGMLTLLHGVDPRLDSWPPASAAEADAYAQAAAAICETQPTPGNCLRGLLPASVSHLYSANFPPELIPDPCRYVAPGNLEACTEGMQAAVTLGGAASSTTATSSG
jgi:hypothetical protein